jgi:hypothetical protein
MIFFGRADLNCLTPESPSSVLSAVRWAGVYAASAKTGTLWL